MNILWILLVGAAAFFLQSVLFTRYGRKHLSYRREFSKAEAHAGEGLVMTEIIENRKWLPVPWLRVETRMPASFRFAAQDNHEIDGLRYHRSIFFLRPYERIVRRHEFVAAARGVFEIRTASLTCGDLFGLQNASAQIDAPMSLTIFPTLLSADEYPMPSSRWQGDLLVKRWIQPDPFLYNGIREYRAGDPIRDIHWRASARVGGLQVLQRDFTAGPRLVVLLNVQLDERQWNQLYEKELPVVERAVSAAATLLSEAIRGGIEAGFGTNGCLEHNGGTVFMPPAGTEKQRGVLMDTLARLRIERVLNFHTYLDAMPDVTGVDFAILTAYVSPLLQQRAALLRARGNSVTFMAYGEGEKHALGA